MRWVYINLFEIGRSCAIIITNAKPTGKFPAEANPEPPIAHGIGEHALVGGLS